MIFCKTILFLMLSISLQAQGTFERLTIPDQVGGRIEDLFFLDEQRGFFCSGSGEILKTEDGGETITLVHGALNLYRPSPFRYNRSIEFLNDSIGICGTLNDLMLRSTDAGETWDSVSLSFTAAGICGIHAFNDTLVMAVGSVFGDAFLITSHDAGETWSYKDMTAYATGLVEIYFLDDSMGFIGGFGETGGVMWKTTDKGQSWNLVFSTQNAGDYIWKIQSLWNDPTFIYASIQTLVGQDNMCKSFDQGDTWVALETPSYDMQGIGFVSKERGWIGGHQSTLLETKDGGTTWSDLELLDGCNRIVVLNDSTIFGGGSSVIFRYDQDELTNVKQHNTSFQSNISTKLYPNPSQGSVTYSITCQQPDNLLLRLYAEDGSLIKYIPYRRLPAGQTEIPLQLKLAPGKYQLVTHVNEGQYGQWLTIIP